MKQSKPIEGNKKLILEVIALLIALPSAYMTVRSCNAPSKNAPSLIRDLSEVDKEEVISDYSEARKLYTSMDNSTLADQTIKAKLVLQAKYRQLLEKFCRRYVPISSTGDPEAFALNIVRCEDSRSKEQLDRACRRAETTILAFVEGGLERSDFEKFRAAWQAAANPDVGVSDQRIYVQKGLELIQKEGAALPASPTPVDKKFNSPPSQISMEKAGAQFAFALSRQSQGQKPVWIPEKDWRFARKDVYEEEKGILCYEWKWESKKAGSYVTLATHSRPFESLFTEACRLFLRDKDYDFVNPSQAEALEGVLPRSSQSIRKGRVFEYRQFVKKESVWFRKVMVYRTIKGVLFTLLVSYPEDENRSPIGTYRQMRSILTSANYWD